MSISTYEFLSIIQAQTGSEPKVETNSADYLGVLESVRSSIALNHARELSAALDDATAIQTLKTLILKYTTEYMAGIDYDRESLVERIYQDMAGLGILTRYLQDPSIEEININAYNQVEIVRPTGTEFLYDNDAFASPDAALDIVKRMIRIEDTQELNLIKYDLENNRPARVISNLTQEAPVKVTMFDLTKGALRYHPALIVPAEVRDGAVYQAMSAGQTGHTILTSFHADSARDSYRRLVSLCHMADVKQTDDILMADCVDAWPIIVFAKQLKDNTRKIMEIFEATGQKNGKVIGHTLYRFNVQDTVRDGHGHVTKVIGNHARIGCISPRLYSRLRDNGAPEQLLQRLFPGAVGEEVA